MGEGLIVRRGGVAGDVELFIEPGLIVEWYGLITQIPDGWQLCDGTNDTPNLIDKFIIGAGDVYTIEQTGGNADSIIPLHNHTTGNTNSVGNHTHAAAVRSISSPYDTNLLGSGNRNGTTATSSNSHSHTISTNSVGESATNANLPPFYTLFYIIKMEES